MGNVKDKQWQQTHAGERDEIHNPARSAGYAVKYMNKDYSLRQKRCVDGWRHNGISPEESKDWSWDYKLQRTWRIGNFPWKDVADRGQMECTDPATGERYFNDITYRTRARALLRHCIINHCTIDEDGRLLVKTIERDCCKQRIAEWSAILERRVDEADLQARVYSQGKRPPHWKPHPEWFWQRKINLHTHWRNPI